MNGFQPWVIMLVIGVQSCYSGNSLNVTETKITLQSENVTEKYLIEDRNSRNDIQSSHALETFNNTAKTPHYDSSHSSSTVGFQTINVSTNGNGATKTPLDKAYISSIDISKTKDNLETGMNIVDTIDKVSDFVIAFTEIPDGVGLFLDAIVSIVKLILGLISGSQESAEMKYLRQLSKQINARFDEFDAQLSDMKKLVKFYSIQAPYLNIALKIRSIAAVYEDLFSVPISVLESQKDLFIESYDSDYQDSGTKLFLGFMQDQGPFGGNLLDSARKFYDNDRPRMMRFMNAITKLLFTASQLELAYLVTKGYSVTLIDFHRRQWEDHFKNILQRMSEVDKKVESHWKDQYQVDIQRFILDNRNYYNSYISDPLYEKLSTKYFWRDWLVIVSDHVYNEYDRNHLCDGYAHTIYVKDVVVTSTPMGNTTMDKNYVDNMANSLRETLSKEDGNINADRVFSWISPYARGSCTDYNAVGIINGHKNTYFSARKTNDTQSNGRKTWPFERLSVTELRKSYDTSYDVYFFG